MFSASVAESAEGRFSGIAYSGGLIANHGFWGNLVFDLESMTIPDNTPLLLEHSVNKRLGIVETSSIDNDSGLSVSGKFLDASKNEHSKAVQDDAAGGFPWQMSVFIEPKSIDYLESDLEINGRTVKASPESPVTVFRNSVIREVSFVAIGADSQTKARAFSESAIFEYLLNEGDMPKPSEKDDLAAANADLKAQLEEMSNKFNAQSEQLESMASLLEQQKQQERNAAIAGIEAETGEKLSDDEKAKFAALDADSFKFMADKLKAVASRTKMVDDLTGDFEFSGGDSNNTSNGDLLQAAANRLVGGE